MKIILVCFYFLVLFFCGHVYAQSIRYTVQNAHSHNDYKQKNPFYLAYKCGFGSMEADVFNLPEGLLVGHDRNELTVKRTLENLYLKPLSLMIKKNNGYPYKDSLKVLQLLIELKSYPDSELSVIDHLLAIYPEIRDNKKVVITFTGMIPSDSVMERCPAYMHFDGDMHHSYSSLAERKIWMFSDDFSHYTAWQGRGPLSYDDFRKLKSLVNHFHGMGKKVRFWGAPDNPLSWKLLEQLDVDYINTDKIELLKNNINTYNASKSY